MIEFKDIDISDRPLFEKYYDFEKNINSEANFTNMFMWHKSYHIQYAVEDGFLVLQANHPSSGLLHQFPFGSGDVRPVLDKLRRQYQGTGYSIRPLSVEQMKFLQEAYPGQYEYTHLRDADDYIYSVEKLMTLRGKKLHSKRNHFNFFKEHYPFTYHKITPETQQACKRQVLKWVEERNEDPAEELEAVSMIFDNYDKLNIKGAYLEAEGKIIAVTIGERMHETALIHIEKADTEYRGVYVATVSYTHLHQRFYKNEAPESPGPPFKSKKNLPPSGTIHELLHFTLGIRYVWLLLLKVHDLKGFLTELPHPSRAEEYF